MALSRKITKAKYDKLSDELKEFYVEKDGDYILDVEKDDNSGGEDTAALKRAKDREKTRADDAEKKIKELEDKLDGVTNGDARKKGDIEALEKSWKEKNDKLKKEYEDREAKTKDFIKKILIDAQADKLAGEISTTPKLMAKHIKERLTVDFDGDEPVARILGNDGKVSAATFDDLRKEIIADKEFAAIIIGSKATGGSTTKVDSTKRKDSASPAENEKVDFTNMTPRQKVEYLENKKEQQEQQE